MAHYVQQKLARTHYAPCAPGRLVGPLTNNAMVTVLYEDTGCVYRGVRISDSCLNCPLSECRYDNLEPAATFVKHAEERKKTGV